MFYSAGGEISVDETSEEEGDEVDDAATATSNTSSVAHTNNKKRLHNHQSENECRKKGKLEEEVKE